jgi:hypothetical protein
MIPAQSALLDEELDASRYDVDLHADQLLHGAADLHVHPSPSPFPRRISIRDAAADAAGAGFRAIVVKSHHLSMQSDVLALRETGQLDLPIEVYGGIALNDTVGGLNPWAVDLVLKLGGRVVWFPTISSPAHIEHHEHDRGGFPVAGFALLENRAQSVLDDDGRLRPEVYTILDIIAEQQAILNTGHLPAHEIDVLLPEASRRGVDRIVISHPEFIVGAGPDDVAVWARLGAHVEHVLGMLISPLATADPIEMLERYKSVGVARTIFSSDLGQKAMPLPVTSYRRLVRRLIDAGYPDEQIRMMTGANAISLLEP